MRYFLTRLLTAIIAAWGALTVVFICLHLSGSPVVLFVEPGASKAELAQVTHALGYDRSLIIQYGDFLHQTLTGSLPDSLQYGRPSMSVVLERMPATYTLAASALLVGTALGVLVGLVAATARFEFVRTAVMSIMVIGQAVPGFYLGILAILVFAVKLEWLPAGGYGSFSSLILPTLTLALAVAPPIARVFRSSVAQVVNDDSIRTARAKGVRRTRLFTRHVIPNAWLPVITIIGLEAGTLLGGTVIVETIFSWPGVGQLAIDALLQRDYPIVLSTVTILIIVFVLLNLLVDMIYLVADPRTRSALGKV